jgi:hypothetical protein
MPILRGNELKGILLLALEVLNPRLPIFGLIDIEDS